MLSILGGILFFKMIHKPTTSFLCTTVTVDRFDIVQPCLWYNDSRQCSVISNPVTTTKSVGRLRFGQDSYTPRPKRRSSTTHWSAVRKRFQLLSVLHSLRSCLSCLFASIFSAVCFHVSLDRPNASFTPWSPFQSFSWFWFVSYSHNVANPLSRSAFIPKRFWYPSCLSL